MAGMGIGRDLYGEVLSSDEVTRSALITRDDPFFAALGEMAFHLGPERDRSVFEGTSLTIVDRLEDATCVINTGPHGFEDTVEMYRDILTGARARDLPMVCANPDLVVIRAGRPVVCAGAIAAEYAVMGGRVAFRGKPDRAVYDAAVAQLGITDRKRIAVVGDALETDVRGANAAGLPAIWCTGGIHAAMLGVAYGIAPPPDEAEKLAFIHGVAVDFTVPGFFW
jgi:HAD superfamily hydrolase (TIGR01459 family)